MSLVNVVFWQVNAMAFGELCRIWRILKLGHLMYKNKVFNA
jgi:hypothetical protein